MTPSSSPRVVSARVTTACAVRRSRSRHREEEHQKQHCPVPVPSHSTYRHRLYTHPMMWSDCIPAALVPPPLCTSSSPGTWGAPAESGAKSSRHPAHGQLQRIVTYTWLDGRGRGEERMEDGGGYGIAGGDGRVGTACVHRLLFIVPSLRSQGVITYPSSTLPQNSDSVAPLISFTHLTLN